MKKTYAFLALLISIVSANAQSGILDTSFGNNGFVNTVISGTYNFSRATVVQPDGKIIVAGEAGASSTYKVATARYDTDGNLDTSFGTNGTQLIPVGSAKSFATDVALQTDGKIILSGYTWDNVSGDIFVIRLNTDGSLDNTFGTNGITIADNGNDISEAVTLQNDGKILVGGYTDDDFTVSRFNTDGTLDSTFGMNGWAFTEFDTSSSYLKDLALQNDGKIVLGGFLINGSNLYQMAAARLNEDGTTDTSFGTSGKVSFNIGAGNDFVEGVVVQQDGKIVLGGHKWISNLNQRHDLAAVRLNENGSFDTTYGNNGAATARIVDGANYSDNMLLQPDGKVIIVGNTIFEGEYDMAMVRFDTDGNLDNTFGTDGMVKTDFNNREDYGKAVALQPDNKIILAGYSYTTGGGASEILVARYDNQILGIETFQNTEFLLYPNPAKEQITIKLSDVSSNYQLEIFDVLGKKVYASEIQKEGQIDVSALASGIYLVKFNSANKSSVVRFVKQ